MTAQPENSQAQAPAPRCRILVVGVGGGACNVVSRALAGWTDAPLVAGINTDAPALAQSDVALKLAIGKNVTKGMGTGGDVEVGRLAASEDLEALRNLVAGHDLLLLVAGLGGGT
ncbi:MAG: cell division protein FtsZ, partial [Kiritimatiellia bacterium]